jgi:peptidoglycan/LPS O-acetylase OafA/YrhL
LAREEIAGRRPGTTNEGERALQYRGDLDGLRAIAVGLILLFHAGIPGIPGGYVGVDVFFVISGFLITGLLVKELGGTGTLDLAAFYARRARRILPASFLVLGATLLAGMLVLSPIGFARAVPAIVASAVYVPNLLFASQVVDYFHPLFVSPVVHYWSLGVEEQFYLVWPAFLLFATRVSMRWGPPLWVWVGGAAALSLCLSLAWTAAAPTQAFYLLPTRAWELGAGGLLALVAERLRGIPAGIATAAGVAGLAAIAGSAVLFDASTPFPGWAALIPVAGTLLVLGAGGGMRRGLPTVVLGTRPFRYVGRISYSLYLWHWPLLLFIPIVLDGQRRVVQLGVAMAATFLLSAATFRWIEDPLRHGRVVGRRPSRNLAAAGLASALVAGLALGGSRLVTQRFEPATVAMPAVGPADPLAGLVPATGPTLDGPLPTGLTPSLLNLHGGTIANNPVDDGCSLLLGQTRNGDCTYGTPDATTEVVLFGDSHLGQWWPAIERLADQRGWKVVYLIKTTCTYADVTTYNSALGGLKTDCDRWRAGVLERIAADRPALVIVSANHHTPPIVNGAVLKGEAAIREMSAGAGRTIDLLRATGAQVAVLADIPQTAVDPADCLTANPDHVLRCARPRSRALDLGWFEAERAITERHGAVFVDVDAWICPSDPCPAVLGQFVVYADTSHLTRPFVAALTGRLDAVLP